MSSAKHSSDVLEESGRLQESGCRSQAVWVSKVSRTTSKL